MNKICGIYKITSPSNKFYIGQSINCLTRKRKYKNGGANSQHRLENSIKKYGCDRHKFEVIHQCEQHELDSLEVYYIQLFQCFNSEHGLNLQSGGTSGHRMSDETRSKISESHKGKMHSEETKWKIGESGKGRVFSNESRLKKSNSLKGKVKSEECRKKISLGNTGKKHTEETKMKMSESKKGYTFSKEMRAKMSLLKKGNKNMLGKKHSPETKEKMRNARLGRKFKTNVPFLKN